MFVNYLYILTLLFLLSKNCECGILDFRKIQYEFQSLDNIQSYYNKSVASNLGNDLYFKENNPRERYSDTYRGITMETRDKQSANHEITMEGHNTPYKNREITMEGRTKPYMNHEITAEERNLRFRTIEKVISTCINL